MSTRPDVYEPPEVSEKASEIPKCLICGFEASEEDSEGQQFCEDCYVVYHDPQGNYVEGGYTQ